MEKPLVSVLTITRNRGKLLYRCINSVLSQTYKNIEYIIVDGASDDDTDHVILSFDDKRLRFIKLDYNWPLFETISYGVSLCSGKYITFLDSDDEYLPEKIEKQVALIDSLPDKFGLVYCWMSYYDNNDINKLIKLHNPKLVGFVPDEVISEPIISGTPTMMFRMDFFRKFGGWKSMDEIGIISDWEMCARACQLTKVNYIPESLVNVYINHGSTRQSESQEYYNNVNKRYIKFHHHFLSFFKDNFDRRPDLKVYHYLPLAIYSFRLRQVGASIKYLIKAFISNPCITVKRFIKWN